MAKVTGPLMSMDASGKFGGTLVFGKWKGRPTVRQLVNPANPMSATQETARNAIRVLGAGQHFAANTIAQRAGSTTTDKAQLALAAPSGQAWNGFLVKSAIGAGALMYAAATAAFAALTAPQRTAWDDAAAALSPAIPAVVQKAADGVPSAPLSAGEVFFHYAYGLYVAGVMTAAPGAVPPVYA
jgi:hypothetical protein